MTLEIDIIVGMTDDTLKHGSDLETRKNKMSKQKRFDQNTSFDMNA